MKKLSRVELEYDDGSISKLVGKDAEEWDKAMNDVMFCYQNHGRAFPKFNWK